MMRTNLYTVEVSPDTDFIEGWVDERIPNMVFTYDQFSIEECEEVNGVYYATYKTWVVEEERQMIYIQPDGVKVTITIPVGEYGIKPDNTSPQ